MSLINLPESFLYRLLPAGLINLDERGLIQGVVSGYQDRLEDLRAYGSKFELFFSAVGLPETGPNVVFVDLTTDFGKVVTRSLNITVDTPTDGSKLLSWAAAQLNVDASSLANARLGLDLLRYVDANVLDYLATNIGAVLYRSAVALAQPDVISSAGTFTASQAAHQRLIETYFPRLKFKGTARSFEALGKLMGFDDVRMVPLWGRVSPRLPNDPGSPVNDPDFSEVPQYFPQQDINPFYDLLNQRDGVYYGWSGTVSNGTGAPNYYPQVINGFQPWVSFQADPFGIQNGTLTPAPAGTYLLDGGAPHYRGRIALPQTGTFVALGEGDSWNGIEVAVTALDDGTSRRLDVTDRLSAIKYRTSYYDLGVTMDADKADALFGTLAARPNRDIAAAPHAYVSYSGTLTGTSPFRSFAGGTAAFQSITGIQTSDFLTPFQGTIAYYAERYEAGLTDAQQNVTELVKAGQGVTQALEEVRPATRSPRRASYGYFQDDGVTYAPIVASEDVLTSAPLTTVNVFGQLTGAPAAPYTTAITLYLPDGTFDSVNTTDRRWPSRVFHTLGAENVTITGFTVPSAGSYNLTVANAGSATGVVMVDFFGTVGPTNDPDTHEVVRYDISYGTQPKRYLDRPEDEIRYDQVFETRDEYPYRRDILGGGETIETDFSVVPGTNYAEYQIFDQTMAVKDQTEVAYDVFVAFGAYPIPQFVTRPKPAPYVPGQRAICFQGNFRDQAQLTVDDLDPFVSPGRRTSYFHSELDNVFQPGYQLYHAGLVNGVLIADADKFNGAHHLDSLQAWMPLNEHPESQLAVNDVYLTLAVQSTTGVAPQDRVWDSDHGFNLRMMPGAAVKSTAFRDCESDLTVSFWINLPGLAVGLFGAEEIFRFGNLSAQVFGNVTDNAVKFGVDTVSGTTFSTAYDFTGWGFVYLRKSSGQIVAGYGNLTTPVVESTVLDAEDFSNLDIDLISLFGASLPYQIRDLRVWSTSKSKAEMELVRYHQPVSTIVPYRIGHVLSLNTGDRYGLQVLPNGWLAASSMPAWVRTPKYASVVRYTGDAEYEGEAYRKEVGLGGGTTLPTPWALGEQFYSLTANGTVVVSTQTGALPGSNIVWQGDTAPGSYIVLSGGSTAQGSIAVVTLSGSGADPWPNRMGATNSAVEAVWLPDDDGHVYRVSLEAQGTAVVFVATPGTASNQEQGDAQAFLARPGFKLGVTGYGAVVQKVDSGTLTTPPLYLYLNDTLLEDVDSSNALARWTDPSNFGLAVGAPALQESGEIAFTNTSVLLPGTYKLKIDLGNIGKVDKDFDGFRIDITVADTTFSETLLRGFSGTNFRAQEEITFTLANTVVGGWILTFAWLNSLSDPARDLTRQLVIYGYTLRRLETNLYSVTLAGAGTTPVLAKVSTEPVPQWGTIPGGWLVTVNSYGTVSSLAHEGTVYPSNDTLRSRYPLANLLTGVTANRREDVITNGTFTLFEPLLPQTILL